MFRHSGQQNPLEVDLVRSSGHFDEPNDTPRPRGEQRRTRGPDSPRVEARAVERGVAPVLMSSQGLVHRVDDTTSAHEGRETR